MNGIIPNNDDGISGANNIQGDVDGILVGAGARIDSIIGGNAIAGGSLTGYGINVLPGGSIGQTAAQLIAANTITGGSGQINGWPWPTTTAAKGNKRIKNAAALVQNSWSRKKKS